MIVYIVIVRKGKLTNFMILLTVASSRFEVPTGYLLVVERTHLELVSLEV